MNATARRGKSSGPQERLEVGVERLANHDLQAAATSQSDTLRLAMFQELAPVHARMTEIGAMDLHEAVDSVQYLAERFGLVEVIGQDAVQVIIAAPFGPRGAQ